MPICREMRIIVAKLLNFGEIIDLCDRFFCRFFKLLQYITILVCKQEKMALCGTFPVIFTEREILDENKINARNIRYLANKCDEI